FPYNSEWKGLVATMEDTLRLHDHRPGTLTGLDRFLHDHTGGMIGSLSHAIRGAAVDAILTGTEKITKKGLQTIPLDHTAHTTASPATKTITPR
ncbi:ATP/GTP-binding protein, partial [Streptomyces scabiei]|nr:ATP/GTP-binding protein [Streptomyces scabiei]